MLGAELHRADRGGDVPVAREQDDRASLRAEPLEQLEPIQVWEMQIEDDDGRADALECLVARPCRIRARDLIPDTVEVVADGAQHVRVVIDEQDAVSHGALRRAARSWDLR